MKIVEIIKKRYEELSEELINPEIINDYNKFKSISKEHSDLETIVKKYEELTNVTEEIEGLKLMVNDPEMGTIAKEELELNETKKDNLIKELEILLIPKDENDVKYMSDEKDETFELAESLFGTDILEVN